MREKGLEGEEIACGYLVKKGYSILDRNVHSRYGELDIVCTRDNILVFCEVKHYKSRSMVSPLAYINSHQKTKIRSTAELYLQQKEEEGVFYSELDCRFDIVLLENGLVIQHLQGVDI